MNLANDVIQNARKKNLDFMNKFFDVLAPALTHISEFGEDSCKKHISRILSVWRERSVYSKEKLDILQTALIEGCGKVVMRSSSSSPLPVKGSQERVEVTPPSLSPTTSPETSRKTKREFQTFSNVSTELVNILRRLEDPASADAKIRQLIASYPETIANPLLLKKIKSYEECQSLTEKINEATPVVEAYCNRLRDELKDRQNAHYLLVDYLKALSEANERTKGLAQSVRRRISHLEDEKKGVRAMIESLPDLNIAMGSTSLPSLTDLFK